MATAVAPSTTGGLTTNTAPAPSTHPYTCNTCQVAFRSSDGQRNHMHTDWHRYNLKRRITELPPISSESFAEKVLSSQASSKAERDRATFEKVCTACGKTYYSENAYNNHVNSVKHKTRVGQLAKAPFKDDGTESVISSTFSMGEPDEDIEVADEEEVKTSRLAADEELSSIVKGLKVSDSTATPSSTTEGPSTPRAKSAEDEMASLPITECLFCTTQSEDLEKNVEHMKSTHGLFIPEQKYLVNLQGLINYLGQKLLIGNTCLYCNKQKGGLEGIRTHMRDKDHCKIAFESEEEMIEVGDFYDFRSSYEDGDEESWEDEETGEKGNNEGWETDSDDSSLASENLGSVPVDQPRMAPKRQPSHHQEDGWHSHAHSHAHTHAIYHSDYELHMPTGRIAGHRSLARYFRQNLHNSSINADNREQRRIEFHPDENRGRAGAMITRDNGGVGLAGAPLAVKKQATKLEKQDRKMAERGRERVRAQVDRIGNQQKHFRDPLLQ